ncbi:MAG: hypothetical protein HQL28_07100, partial [Candidatus Omnitrophica bacterium]|nr:hypothetical protein [Candidatus Omnitrophota bacterium]
KYATGDKKEPLMGVAVKNMDISRLLAASKLQLLYLKEFRDKEPIPSFDSALNKYDVQLSVGEIYELLRIGRSGHGGLFKRIARFFLRSLPYRGIELETYKLYRALKMAETVALESETEFAKSGIGNVANLRAVIRETKDRHYRALEEMIKANETLRKNGSSAYKNSVLIPWFFLLGLFVIPFTLIFMVSPLVYAYVAIHGAYGILGNTPVLFLSFLNRHSWIVPAYVMTFFGIALMNWIYKDFYVLPEGLYTAKDRIKTKDGSLHAVRGAIDVDVPELANFILKGENKEVVKKFMCDHPAELEELARTNIGLARITAEKFIEMLFSDINLYKLGKQGNAPPRVLVDEFLSLPEIETLFPRYAVVLPAFGEPNVIAALIKSISCMVYPRSKLDIVLLTEASDLDKRSGKAEAVSTMEVVLRELASDPKKYSNITVLTSPIRLLNEHNQSKPYSTNYALGFVADRKDKYLVIYDAEDKPYPLQLMQAAAGFEEKNKYLEALIMHMSMKMKGSLTAFEYNVDILRMEDPLLYKKVQEYRFDTKLLQRLIGEKIASDGITPGKIVNVREQYEKVKPLGVLQAPLTWYNPSTLTAAQFILDYATWFTMFLPGLESKNLPVAHGGTSNHFLIDGLIKVGGWDGHNVTEDAQIAGDFQRAGYECLMLTPSITLEEVLERHIDEKGKWAWTNERSRWNKGYIQVFSVLLRNLATRPNEMLKVYGLKGVASMIFLFGGGAFGPLLNVLFYSTSTLWVASKFIVLGPLWSTCFMLAAAFCVFIIRGGKDASFLKVSAIIAAMNLMFYHMINHVAVYYLNMVPHAFPIIPWLSGCAGNFIGVLVVAVFAFTFYVLARRPGAQSIIDRVLINTKEKGALDTLMKGSVIFTLYLGLGILALMMIGRHAHPYLVGVGLFLAPMITHIFYNLAAVYKGFPQHKFIIHVIIDELSKLQKQADKDGNKAESARIAKIIDVF